MTAICDGSVQRYLFFVNVTATLGSVRGICFLKRDGLHPCGWLASEVEMPLGGLLSFGGLRLYDNRIGGP